MAAEPGGYVVGWGTLALINAGLAQAKNRSGLAWFFLSLLLGPLATFVLLLMEKLPSEP
jgi:biotin transporter BioY